MHLIVTDKNSYEFRGYIKAIGFIWKANRKQWIMHSTNEERLNDAAIHLEDKSIEYVKVKTLPKLTKGYKNYINSGHHNEVLNQIINLLIGKTRIKAQLPLSEYQSLKTEIITSILKYINKGKPIPNFENKGTNTFRTDVRADSVSLTASRIGRDFSCSYSHVPNDGENFTEGELSTDLKEGVVLPTSLNDRERQLDL